MPRATHRERHRSSRAAWLRAAVLGANDGMVSTAALVVGVSAAGADARAVLTSGIAGAVAGAMSMAAGEYVPVRSQAGCGGGRSRDRTTGAGRAGGGRSSRS